MASTGHDYVKDFTISNQAITDLGKLLMLRVLQFGSINETLDLLTGVVPGSRLGGIGQMHAIGTPANGCTPVWNATAIDIVEKVWDLGAYEIAESICYQDLEDTLVQFSMKTGTERSDLTTTDYMNIVVVPTLTQAFEKMIWRLLWFGDKAAANVAGGGHITAGIPTNLFTICDGLFKRLLSLTTANPAQRVTIAANTQATKALQISTMRTTAGAATTVFDQLIYDAPAELRQANDKVILVTQSLADALSADMKSNNRGSNLQWQSLFNGFVSATEYNGEKILALPLWDEMIRNYEDAGTTFNKPHRAVFASKLALKGGINSAGTLANLDIWFSKDYQKNFLLARDKVGTLLFDDKLIMFAF